MGTFRPCIWNHRVSTVIRVTLLAAMSFSTNLWSIFGSINANLPTWPQKCHMVLSLHIQRTGQVLKEEEYISFALKANNTCLSYGDSGQWSWIKKSILVLEFASSSHQNMLRMASNCDRPFPFISLQRSADEASFKCLEWLDENRNTLMAKEVRRHNHHHGESEQTKIWIGMGDHRLKSAVV